MSGNPHGRERGSRNRVTVEARKVASELVDNPAYRQALAQRLLDGTAGAMEVLMWIYSKGKPQNRAEADEPGALAKLSNEELKARLVAAATAMQILK